MKIGVIGASGFVGKTFSAAAGEAGHEVVGFSRSVGRGEGWRVWDEEPNVEGLDAVVNFAGESVAQRWTEKKKEQFHSSRVGVTETLVRQIQALPAGERPKVILNASAVGYYGDRGDEKLDETSSRGDGFLSDLCLEWENAALAAEDLGVRVVLGRIGLVIGKGGEAWSQMKTVFSLGGGGVMGTGEQWMPWINVADVAGGTLHALITEEISGAMNLVSPDPRTNRDFTQALARHLKRPAIMPVPEFALRMLYGEFGKHLLDSYRTYPTVLEKHGYEFVSAQLEDGLADIS